MWVHIRAAKEAGGSRVCQRQPRRASREPVQVSRSTRTVVPRRPAAADQASAPRTSMSCAEAANARGGGQCGVVAIDGAGQPVLGDGRRLVCRPGVDGIPPVPLLTVGLDLCGLDRPRGDAALPSSPGAEPRKREKEESLSMPRRASPHGGVGQRAAPRRPAASAWRRAPSDRCRRWPRRGARLTGGAAHAGFAAHFITSRSVLPSPPDPPRRADVSLILGANAGHSE